MRVIGQMQHDLTRVRQSPCGRTILWQEKVSSLVCREHAPNSCSTTSAGDRRTRERAPRGQCRVPAPQDMRWKDKNTEITRGKQGADVPTSLYRSCNQVTECDVSVCVVDRGV